LTHERTARKENTVSQHQLVPLVAEGTEAEFMYLTESSAPPSIRSMLGISATRIGGGVALSMRHDVTGFWSKALGFGFDAPITDAVIGEVVDFYRAEGSQGAVIQIAPSVLPPDWDDICAHYDLKPDSPWVKLACPIDAFQPGRTRMRVGPVAPDAAQEWASVILRGFGMPEDGLAEMLAATVDVPGFQPFAVWDGDDMVAGANLFVHGEVGSLNAAATLPVYRNRGAQSALLAARASRAADAGCRWLIAETGEPAPGSTNPSLDNMRRAGLRPLYSRQNWIWRPDRPS
jgi:GNAT superfamily N-acetyltransferase